MDFMKMYILEGKVPVVCEDRTKYLEWFSNHLRRRVAKTEKNDIVVSTVFLGLNHGIDAAKPILFETMVFGGKFDSYAERYSTWEEAERGHENMVNLVFPKVWWEKILEAIFRFFKEE
jgi:hypothetical protein